MTQTQTPPAENPDPDRRPDPDPGPDQTRTQTPDPTRTQTRPDPSPGPDGGPGPDAAQTQTQTPDRTPTPKVDTRPGGSGLDETQTQTPDAGRAARSGTALRSWVGRGGYITALTVIVAIVAAIGQKLYAVDEKFVGQIGAFGFDLTPWFAPFVFDLAVAALLHGGLNAARDRFSPWPWWTGAAVVAGLSVWTNTQHVGAQITASASAGLFLIWGLHLYNKYKKIVREREVEDSAADKLVSTDVLFTVDKVLAQRAWLIARTKPLAAGLAYRHRLGEVQLTERDVAILAARIYNDVYADQLDVLMNPAPTTREDGTVVPGEGRVWWWQSARRRRALRLARMTAGDAVDFYLGLPVPERQGVRVARVTYAVQDDRPLLGAVTATPPAPPVAAAAAPAAPALPAAQPATVSIVPASRRRAIPASEPVVIVASGAPAGLAGLNWLSLAEIPGLPELNPAVMCQCHKDSAKWCGKTLVEHVQRRGRYVKMIVTTVDRWDTRPERIGKDLIKETCDLRSDGVLQELTWVFDQLRTIAQAQIAGQAAVTVDGEVTATAPAEVNES
jgi:hypothetical protein